MVRTSHALAFAVLLGLIAAPLVAAPAAAATQAVLIASPTGSGSTCSVAAPCSLTGARTAARALIPTMTGDIEIQLRGGTYALSSAFVLTDADSGRNGFRVIYRAYPSEKPVLSGGTQVTGWTVADAGLGIYSANVASGFATRQLFVDGVRAIRARGNTDPGGFTYVAATGYTTTNSAMQNWGNRGDIEFVDYNAWKSFRCGVASIAGTAVTMDAACWANAKRHAVKMDGVTWVENAYELLDQAGEWYLDRTQNKLFYIPRAGENLASAVVTTGTTESLLEIAGTVAVPVQNVTVTGLTFSYNTWLRPNTAEGYPTLQAAFMYETRTAGGDPNSPAYDLLKTPAAVTISAGLNVLVERNTFTHLGSAGLNLEAGTQNTIVRGNVFTDISSSAVQVGHINDSHATAAATLLDNEVSNNFIQDIAVEYHDGVGVWVGYTDGTRVLHNEIARVPYSGISLGWGWGCVDAGQPCGFATASVARDNEVAYNLIQDSMRTLVDGGSVYTLGTITGTTVHDNFVNGQSRPYGALYFDQGSKGIAMTGNVVASAYRWYISNANLANNTLSGNWANPETGPTPNPLAGNETALLTWPAGARAVIASAGLEPAYAGIRPSGAVTGDLAQGKTATASSQFSGSYAPTKAFDGDLASGWSPLATVSDPRPWIQVDLGSRYQISHIDLVTRQGSADFAETRQDFEIQVSNDPAFATYIVLGGQGSTPLAHQSTFTLASSIAAATGFRYVRAIKTVDGYFYVNDLRVFGATVQPPNVAIGKTATASSQLDAANAPSMVVNGNISTGWSPVAPATDPRPWVQIDLGAKHQVARVEFVTRQNVDHSITRQDFELQASNDPTFATYTVLGSQGSTPLAHASTWTLDVADIGAYQYIRLAKSADGYFYVAELRVFGAPSAVGNLAAGKVTSASTVFDSTSVHPNAVDTLIATGWSPVGPEVDPRPWIQVDLGGAFRLGSIDVVTRQSSPDWPVTRQDFEVRASNDPTFATYTVLATQGSTPLAYRATLTQAVSDPTPFRYVRVIKTVDAYFYVAELRVFQ